MKKKIALKAKRISHVHCREEKNTFKFLTKVNEMKFGIIPE